MDIEKTRPDDRLARYVRHYVTRRARIDGQWRIAHGHNTNIDAHAAAHDPSRPSG